MKKTSIALSFLVALSTSSFGAKLSHDDLQAQIEALKAQIALLEQRVNQATEKTSTLKLSEVAEKRIKKIEKKVASNYKKINKVKQHDAGDNIKWDIDFRTQVDNINYKLSNGTTAKNNALMTNRLWLGMGYSPNDNTIFKGTLAYNKAYGDSANHSQANTTPGYANFDWVTNENANDNTIKVKEAFWLYKDDSFMGNKDLPWTVSVGRRPSTDGLGINVRADQERKSALSHTVNVEFDGLSARFDLDKITGVEGMWWKFCGGRGLTNAKPRFSSDGLDYANDNTKNPNIDMAGFIFVPYDNGQYSVHTNYAKAWNMIGFTQADMFDGNNANNTFKDFGDLELATVMFKVDGIGDEISDYLDNTIAFASFAASKTHPNSLGMLGSTESKTGSSIWLGINAPCPIDTEDSRIGIEWNKGSKYWRPMTYGEDTMVGSKIATRGTAWEVYRNSKINNALSWSLRYTKINYDYYGSNGFFGYDGNPDLGSVSTYVTEAQNITANVRYRF